MRTAFFTIVSALTLASFGVHGHSIPRDSVVSSDEHSDLNVLGLHSTSDGLKRDFAKRVDSTSASDDENDTDDSDGGDAGDDGVVTVTATVISTSTKYTTTLQTSTATVTRPAFTFVTSTSTSTIVVPYVTTVRPVSKITSTFTRVVTATVNKPKRALETPA